MSKMWNLPTAKSPQPAASRQSVAQPFASPIQRKLLQMQQTVGNQAIQRMLIQRAATWNQSDSLKKEIKEIKAKAKLDNGNKDDPLYNTLHHKISKDLIRDFFFLMPATVANKFRNTLGKKDLKSPSGSLMDLRVNLTMGPSNDLRLDDEASLMNEDKTKLQQALKSVGEGMEPKRNLENFDGNWKAEGGLTDSDSILLQVKGIMESVIPPNIEDLRRQDEESKNSETPFDKTPYLLPVDSAETAYGQILALLEPYNKMDAKLDDPKDKDQWEALPIDKGAKIYRKKNLPEAVRKVTDELYARVLAYSQKQPKALSKIVWTKIAEWEAEQKALKENESKESEPQLITN